MPPPLKRRTFLGCAAAAGANPRAAALDWFRAARFGMFLHYGPNSLPGRGDWLMLREKIPVPEYRKLAARFTAARFDADRIAGLAIAAGMKYVNLTTKHHDGYCLFRTRHTEFNSVDGTPRRDLVAELAGACRRKGLRLFLYYSYALDWWHPYFLPREAGWPHFRPDYNPPDPHYLYRKEADFRRYIDFVHNQLRELLTQYGPIAGIWFDPVMGYYARPDLFPIAETYALIRSLQPECLISFKQGASGDEDFAAPERAVAAHSHKSEVALRAWEKNRGKPAEICDTLQPRTWFYNAGDDGKHHGPDQVMKMLAGAREKNANLLLNIGPLPDGSIPAQDDATLREVGRRRQSL